MIEQGQLKSYWNITTRDFREWLTPQRALLITVFAVLISVACYVADPFEQALLNTLNSTLFGMVAVQYARIAVKLNRQSG